MLGLFFLTLIFLKIKKCQLTQSQEITRVQMRGLVVGNVKQKGDCDDIKWGE